MTAKQAKDNYITAKAIYIALSDKYKNRHHRRENRLEIAEAYNQVIKAEVDLIDISAEQLEKEMDLNLNNVINTIVTDANARSQIAVIAFQYLD